MHHNFTVQVYSSFGEYDKKISNLLYRTLNIIEQSIQHSTNKINIKYKIILFNISLIIAGYDFS